MSQSGFQLHETLARDTLEVTRWELSLVLMMRERRWPWLILVPRRSGLREIHKLPASERALLIEEIARAGEALGRAFGADKINIGALGNVVSQLHVHVVARHVDDPAWPGPVWGALPFHPLGGAELAERLARIQEAFG